MNEYKGGVQGRSPTKEAEYKGEALDIFCKVGGVGLTQNGVFFYFYDVGNKKHKFLILENVGLSGLSGLNQLMYNLIKSPSNSMSIYAQVLLNTTSELLG